MDRTNLGTPHLTSQTSSPSMRPNCCEQGVNPKVTLVASFFTPGFSLTLEANRVGTARPRANPLHRGPGYRMLHTRLCLAQGRHCAVLVQWMDMARYRGACPLFFGQQRSDHAGMGIEACDMRPGLDTWARSSSQLLKFPWTNLGHVTLWCSITTMEE